MNRGYRLRLWFLWSHADRKAWRKLTPLERAIVRAFCIPPSLVRPQPGLRRG